MSPASLSLRRSTGKPALEQCLVSLSEHTDPAAKELIIIDNASLDDTHDYLEELREKNFFNCSIITNKQNKGFAASVNQGLDAAHGQYACILHNDVQFNNDAIDQLKEYMELYPNYAILGPLTNKTLNPDQSTRTADDHSGDITKAEYLDSFCMMVRTDADLRMDESYELSFFEDIDFCFQARKKGHRVGIASGITVEHYYGTTTFALNLDTESDQYWKNVSYFNDKWGVEVYSEEELKSHSTFDQLLMLDELVNPLYPEQAIKDYFEELFTDELKTEMMRSQHDEETLCRLVHLMMVMEEREIMRRLEDRLNDVELPASLIYQLVRFYYNRNIYSRCLHYLDQLKAEQQSLQSELYRLKIRVNEKELEQAIPKLTDLLDRYPSNPELYKLAGDVHSFEGNEEEAKSFYQIAQQIDPFRYTEEGEAKVKNTLL
ncbi:MAG: glycosyltransferase [Balneolaceae bacterium]|nr:glycosyltransferase [Balneolaceae bacterium]